MTEHIEKLVKSTQSHHAMRGAMSKRSLEIAAELDEQRQERAQQLAADQAKQPAAGDGNGQGTVS